MKVKDWKELVVFEPIRDGRLDVDGTVSMIAKVRNTTVEDIENTIEIDELLPEFLKCVREANELIFSKLDAMPKNAEGDSK